MFVPDETATAAYRAAITTMGFSPMHAELILVEIATRRTERTDGFTPPLYRISTGTDVMRAGRTMRRTLTLWYVSEHAELLADMEDAETLADMIVATIPLLPVEMRKSLPAIPACVSARGEVVQIGLSAAHRARRAA